jgi:spermidine synthase
VADWVEETFPDGTRFALRVTKRLHATQSPFQRIEIVETAVFGRVLVLDGIFQTSERDEHVYHEMLVHPVLTTARSISRVLVIGGGDGGTVREVLRHTGVERCTMVEIDREVVEASRRYLPGVGTAWDDPRLELVIGDGVEYVQDAPADAFDVVLLDGSDPVGPSEGLFDRRFYEGCRRVLCAGGVLAVQSESPFLTPGLFRKIVTLLRDVFGRAAPAIATVPLYSAGPWSFTLASTTAVPAEIVSERAERIESTCKYWSRRIHGASFVLPPDVAATLCNA